MEMEQYIQIVREWLNDISQAMNIHLEIDSNGICTFQVDGNIIALEVSQNYPMIHIYSPLITLPSEDKDLCFALCARALEINSFQILTRGGSIASVPGGNVLMYCYSAPIEGTDSGLFSQILGAFYETLPELKNLLLEMTTNLPNHPYGKGIKI